MFKGEVIYIIKENRIIDLLDEKRVDQTILGFNKDQNFFSSSSMKLMKQSKRKTLVYCLDSNDIQVWNFTAEEIEVPSSKDHVLSDFTKKFGKLHQRKASRWLTLDYKKKDKIQVYRFSKRSSSQSVKPSVVKYENLLESTYYGRQTLT